MRSYAMVVYDTIIISIRNIKQDYLMDPVEDCAEENIFGGN